MQLQIFLLMAIRAIRMFSIMMPVIVLYWQNNGLSMQDIFILQVIYSVAIVALEIPTGYFSDTFGHKNSIIIGYVFGALGCLLYWAFPSLIGFICAEIGLALSASFLSGARDALLYDTLQAHTQTNSYTKLQGRNATAGNFSEATAAILAGVIASKSSIETVLLIQWLVTALAIPLSFMLVEYRTAHERKTPPLLQILRGNFVENKRLLALNFFAGGISAGGLVMVWFVQPHWQALGINIVYFGYLWAFLNVVVGVGSLIAHYFEKHLSFTVLFGGLALMPLTLFVTTAFMSTSLWVLCIVPFFWLLRGVSLPIIQDYVQRECGDAERATVLSINTLVGRVVFSVFSPLVGYFADVYTLAMAFYASGMIFGSLTLISFFFFWKASRLL